MYVRILEIFLLITTLVSSAHTQERRSRHYINLIQTYSPVWVQELEYKPVFDKITRVDFDGDYTSTNNVLNANHYSLPPVVYGELIAETTDSYYLFYGVYHVADYDKPLREFFIPSSRHDNDFEGAFLLVNKQTKKIDAIETWYHSKFLQFAHVADMRGTQTIDGKIHVEDLTHPILFVQGLGHGVRVFQKIDEDFLKTGRYQIYRYNSLSHHSHHLPKTTAPDDIFTNYTISSLDTFSQYAQGPFGGSSLFDDPQDFGLGGKPLGKYFSGFFTGDSSWARPKPPWSWCDHFDTFRPGALFFHPAYIFNRHFNFKNIDRYVYNYGLKYIARTSVTDLNLWAEQKVPSFFDTPSRGFYGPYVKKLRKSAYRIAEYLFYVFG